LYIFRNPYFFLGLIIIFAGLSHIMVAQVPMNLDDWVGIGDWLVVHIWAEDTLNMDVEFLNPGAFVFSTDLDDDTLEISLYLDSNEIYEILDDEEPLNGEIEIVVGMTVGGLGNYSIEDVFFEAVSLQVNWLDHYFEKVNVSEISSSDGKSFDVKYWARDLKKLNKVPWVSGYITVNLNELKKFNITRASISIHISTSFLRRTCMVALVPQGAVLVLFGCFVFLVGLVRSKVKSMPFKWVTLICISISLISLGNILLHYVWYRIANMRVVWSIEPEIYERPAPKPFWSKGPWSKLPYGENIDSSEYFGPISNPEQGYTVSYILSLFWLSNLAFSIMIFGFILLGISLFWWLHEAYEIVKYEIPNNSKLK